MSSGRSTLVAWGVVAALGLTYWGWVVKLKPQREKAKEDAKLIFPGTDAASLKSILLRKKGSPDVRLDKTDGKWNLTQPIQAPADQSVVQDLVSQLATAKRDEIVVAKDADQHEFGLDQPSGAVTFQPTSPGAKPLALFFGSDNPTGAQTYAMVDGRPEVFLTAMGVKTAALKDAADLRDKTVWTFDTGLVQGLRLGALDLSKAKDGTWTVGKGAAAEPAKNSVVGAWLEQLAGLRAQSVPSEDGKGKFGLVRAKRLTLSLSDGRSLTLLKGSNAKPSGFYVQVQGATPVYLLPAADQAAFGKGVVDIADRNAFDLVADEVQRFEVRGAAGKLDASRKQGVWGWDGRVAAPGEKAFDFDAFVRRFGGAQLLKRLPASRRPTQPRWTVSFYGDGGTLLEKAEFGGKLRPGVVAFSAEKRSTNVVASNLMEGLPPLKPAPPPGAAGGLSKSAKTKP